jgi:tape measure domain-containing protein
MKDIVFPITYKHDDKGLKRAEQSLEKFGKVVGGVGLAAAGAIAAAGAGLLAKAITSGFDRLTSIDNATNKLQGLGHTTQEVETIMESALASVKGTAFGLGDAATIAASAVAAGIEPGKELTRYLTLTADAAAIAGVSLEEMGSTMNNVRTIGAAYNDSLQILAQKGIPIYTMLAEKLGITTEEVKRLASEGGISAELFETVMEEKFGGAALKGGETVEGAFANMEAAIARAGAALLGSNFDDLPATLGGITEKLDELTPKFQAIGENLSGIGNEILPILNPALDLLGDLLFIVSLGFSNINDAAPETYTNLALIADVVGVITDAFATFDEFLSGTKNSLNGWGPVIAGVFNSLKFALDPFFGTLKMVWALIQNITGDSAGAARTMGVNVPTVSSQGRGRIQGRAAGGGAANDGLSWVGEKGPELISMPRGATVTPIPQHMRADAMFGANRNGGGGNMTVLNITVNGGLDSSAQIGEAVVNAIRKYERTSGAVFARA